MMAAVTERATPIEPDIHAEAQRLLAEIERTGIAARLIGGMAIRLLAADHLPAAFERPIQDLDFILSKRHRPEWGTLMIDSGYAPQERFNALHGAHRLLYDDPSHGRQIDVFVESFSMCHELPLAERIPVRPHTLPPADVLMTKLQIVQLNEKDRRDLYALLYSHTVSAGREGEGGGGDIDVERIVALTANDWGLQHTFELNLSRLRAALPEQPLDAAEAASVAERIDLLAQALERAPKTRRWKLRAKVGERKRWYEEPEEVDR
jgi:Uncharacterised nucleotidyltransferase